MDVQWQDGPPPVDAGGIGYFLVVTSRSKKAFGAHFLNRYKLIPRDDCPDATKENGFTPCQSCESCDGHEFSGWYNEGHDADGEVFMPMDRTGEYAVLKWSHMPVNPFYLPLPTSIQRGV